MTVDVIGTIVWSSGASYDMPYSWLVFDVPNDATPAERAKFATEAVLNSAGAGSFSSAVGMANVTITVVSWD